MHEYLWCPEPRTEALLEGARILNLGDGARSYDPLKYRRDALVLERALLDEPRNERYVFYLAQSYRDAGDLDLAVRHYRRRVEMGGWIEEVWYSELQIADAMARQGSDWPSVLAAYLAAYERRPQRAEPLFRIARHYMGVSQYETAALFLEQAARIPYPAEDKLFVEQDLYRFIMAMERAVCAYWRGRHDEAIRLNNALLAGPDLPQEQRGRVTKNRRFSLDALHLPAPPQANRRGTPRGCPAYASSLSFKTRRFGSTDPGWRKFREDFPGFAPEFEAFITTCPYEEAA